MRTYLVIRRNGWTSRDQLQTAGERSFAADEDTDEVRWLRSYVFVDRSGLSTMCILEATGHEAIEAHARAADLPIDEIRQLDLTMIVREEEAATDTR